jgi:DNA repair exonuclease SbcCD ATPase subunit
LYFFTIRLPGIGSRASRGWTTVVVTAMSSGISRNRLDTLSAMRTRRSAARASKLLQRIAGKRIGAISLNDDLAPWGVGPAETDETIDLEILSAGQREQVHLAVRLALAKLLTKNAGQK